MAMVIKNNAAAQAALGELKKNNDKLSNDLKKVASGMKINGARDDASGYSISERMRVQLRGLEQDNANAQNATSLLKTADGAISSTVDLLKTMKEKAINAANDTNTDLDRATIQKEINQSIDQLEDNANVTFNNKILFDGSVGAGDDVKQVIVKGLNSEWMESSLQLIKDTYGISFTDDTASVRDIKLNFTTGTGSALASVSYTAPGGVTDELNLNISMDYYADLVKTDPSGWAPPTSSAAGSYLDRTLAHEFTHAVMASNIRNMDSLPLYIIEGAAEYTHGIDDERVSALSSLAAGTIDSDSGEDPYAAGYAFLHYLNAKSGHDGMAIRTSSRPSPTSMRTRSACAATKANSSASRRVPMQSVP